MKRGEVFRLMCIVLLWLWLCWLLLTRAQLNFWTLFWVVASGIIVFVPLYKKYVLRRRDNR